MAFLNLCYDYSEQQKIIWEWKGIEGNRRELPLILGKFLGGLSMEFSDFAKKYARIFKGSTKIGDFTREIFMTVFTKNPNSESKDKAKAVYEILFEKRSDDIYKKYYYGTTPIKNISSLIHPFLSCDQLEKYLNDLDDSVTENLHEIFKEDIKEYIKETNDSHEEYTTGYYIAKILNKIILDATEKSECEFENKEKSKTELPVSFSNYLNKAKSYYSTKKILIYPYKPLPFSDIYVNTNIKFDTRSKNMNGVYAITNATLEKLEDVSNHIIIHGAGGSGKSIFLNSLFLNAVETSNETKRIPVLISLKHYCGKYSNLLDLIMQTVNEFDDCLDRKNIIDLLQKNRIILFLDGLDELKSSFKNSFNQILEVFTKAYPEITVIITSRPIEKFLSFTKFIHAKLLPLTLKQATSLVNKINFLDTETKTDFIKMLKSWLYDEYIDFASNPLLLSIMLMTYYSYGKIPKELHIFYKKTYETMYHLHDESKGSFNRVFKTGLSSEDFSKYFAEFCARTYIDELLEFNENSFAEYMNKTIEKIISMYLTKTFYLT